MVELLTYATLYGTVLTCPSTFLWNQSFWNIFRW